MTPSLDVKRKFIKSLKGKNYKVKTDTGWSPIKYCHKTVDYGVWQLTTTRHQLKCADTHIVFRSNEFNDVLDEVYVKDLLPGDKVSTIDGYDTVVSVIDLDISSHMYDLELDDDNHRYYSSNILSHNSATTRAFILWYALFNSDKVVAVLGNKLTLAQEQLQQLRDSYLNLPYWMQPGVSQWNKRAIQFSNGTRVICAATSPDGIRGMSINLLYLDEFAFVKSHLADEFIASVFPTISSGKTTKVIITSTPNGMNHFFRMWQDADESSENNNGYTRSEIAWNAVPGRDEAWARDEMKKIGEIRFNQEYRCEFIGSVSTLIDHHFLKSMTYKPALPIQKLPPYIKIWDLPKSNEEIVAKGWEYVASLDSGYGIYKDNTVLQVFLAKSNITVHQVAVMSSNSMEIDVFCKKARALLRKYNDPSLIIEQNGPGIAATKYFHNEAEYENLLHFDPKGRSMGLWATEKLKHTAVILLKSYIQRKFLKIYDSDTINELHSFGQVTASKWGALGGNKDDHITSLYWIPYYLQSPYFYGNIVDVNIKSLPDDDGILSSDEDRDMESLAFNEMKDRESQLNELRIAAEYLPEAYRESQLDESSDDDMIDPDNNEDNSVGPVVFRR